MTDPTAADYAAELLDALRPPTVPPDVGVLELDTDGQEWVDGIPLPEDAESRNEWRPVDIGEADYLTRLIARERAACTTAEETARQVVERAIAWAHTELAAHSGRARWLEERLAGWHDVQIANGAKATITLPSGATLKRTAGRVSCVVDDEMAAVAWADALDLDTIVYVPEPPAPRIDKKVAARILGGKVDKLPGEYPAVTADGEICEAIRFVRPDPTHKVTFTDDDTPEEEQG